MSEARRILVVDDEADFAAIVHDCMQKEGFAVEIAYDGMEALEKVRANPPDAIILDVMMPKKDGYAVCAELKADQRYRNIPIVMLTAVADHFSSTSYSHNDGLNMEADDYLPKPASAEEISTRVKNLLG